MPDPKTLREQLQDRAILPGSLTPRTVDRPTEKPRE